MSLPRPPEEKAVRTEKELRMLIGAIHHCATRFGINSPCDSPVNALNRVADIGRLSDKYKRSIDAYDFLKRQSDYYISRSFNVDGCPAHCPYRALLEQVHQHPYRYLWERLCDQVTGLLFKSW